MTSFVGASPLHNSLKPTLGLALLVFLSALSACSSPGPQNPHYEQRADEQAWAKSVSEKHPKLDLDFIQNHLKQAKRLPKVIRSIKAPAERTLTWERYESNFIPGRVNSGVAFWKLYQHSLQKASQRFGVPASIITAIIGVETAYGTNFGNYLVLDALTTHAFDGIPRRRGFFRNELAHFLMILKNQPALDAQRLLGSYAGAMGWVQFMPSSLRAYGIDGDKDQKIDFWNSIDDMTYSIANYLKQNKWKRGEPYLIPVTYQGRKHFEPNHGQFPERDQTYQSMQRQGFKPIHPQTINPHLKVGLLVMEKQGKPVYYLVTHNFRVVSRYNPRVFYTLSVTSLAKHLERAF